MANQDSTSSPDMDKFVVVVAGDLTVDWAIEVQGHPSPSPEGRLESHANARWHWGGSILLGRFLEEAVECLDAAISEKMHLYSPKGLPYPPRVNENRVHYSYNTTKLWPSEHEGEGDKDRIDQYLGFCKHGKDLDKYELDYDCMKDDVKIKDGRMEPNDTGPMPIRTRSDIKPQLIVLDDAGLGFGLQSERCEDFWPPGIFDEEAQEDPAWLILKLRGESLNNPLWEKVLKDLQDAKSKDREIVTMADRLVVVTTARSLRAVGAEISSDLSWERSAQDALSEIVHDPKVNNLSKCSRVIISFGPAGALLIDRRSAESQDDYTLYFDKVLTERDWENKERRHGKMFGYSQALVAAIAARFVKLHKSPKDLSSREASKDVHEMLEEGIKDGLLYAQRIYDEGFSSVQSENSSKKRSSKDKPVGGGEIKLSLKRPSSKLPSGHRDKRNPVKPLSARLGRSLIPDPERGEELDSSGWSILNETFIGKDPRELAQEIVQHGTEKLDNIPLGRFGNLLKTDREEIEALRSVQNLLIDYVNHPEKREPRSIAVFGAPGDGKSYAVREVAKAIDGTQKEPLEFNLSQFKSAEDLTAALQKVRDACLEGNVPLVFWDEFDVQLGNQDLGWLPHFLAPMQDGKFHQDHAMHPIGKSVFVFAGGICRSFDEFKEKARANRQVKATDFISRLRGFIDIVGFNPGPNSSDLSSALLQRAILLHYFLGKAGIAGTNIDTDVLAAFLDIKEYRHGARSMDAIVDASRLNRGGAFGRSALPPRAQLDLHVDADAFLEIVRSHKS